jgi:hypothetical protein
MNMRPPRTVLLATSAIAVIVAAGAVAPAGTTSALWREQASIPLGTLRLAQVDVELQPDFHADDLVAGQYLKVTPGDDYTVVSFQLLPRLGSPDAVGLLTVSFPETWQLADHDFLHAEILVNGIPVPASGDRFEHAVHLVPEGQTWTGGGHHVTVSPDDGVPVTISLHLWRDHGGGQNFVLSPTELTATLQKLRDGRPVGVLASATTFVPGFYKGAAPASAGTDPVVIPPEDFVLEAPADLAPAPDVDLDEVQALPGPDEMRTDAADAQVSS